MKITIKSQRLLKALVLLLVFQGLIFHVNPQEQEEISISGRIRTLEDDGVPGVILVFSDNLEIRTAVTDRDGKYNRTLEPGWTGTVTPLKSGYRFNPPSTKYEFQTSGLPDGNYSAEPVPPVIQGRVTAKSGTGLAGVMITASREDGISTNTVTDFNGHYRLEVPHGWTGAVTPSKTGYIFEPGFLPDDTPGTDWRRQNYIAITPRPCISGMITGAGGMGVPGVTLTFSNNGGTALTDANGKYHHAVEEKWSGTVSPSKTGYSFYPDEVAYNKLKSDHTLDYTAATFLPVISGTVKGPGGLPAAGVKVCFSRDGETGGAAGASVTGTGTGTDTGSYTYTGVEGRYHHAVEYGWSGGVTLSKAWHAFIPGGIDYSGVQESIDSQDYSARKILLDISGTVLRGESHIGSQVPFPGVALEFSGLSGTAVSGTGGDFKYNVPYGWSGKVTPEKEDFLFLPASQAYSRLNIDMNGQVFQSIPGNIALKLQVRKKTAGTLLIKRDYAEITAFVEAIEGEVPIKHYIIRKKEKGGGYRSIGEPKPLLDGKPILDRDIETGKTYIYILEAIHESGIKIKESNEQEI